MKGYVLKKMYTQVPKMVRFNCKIYIINLNNGIRQPEGGSRARVLDKYFFLRRRSDGRMKKTAKCTTP
jgi:hypothetical protein